MYRIFGISGEKFEPDFKSGSNFSLGNDFGLYYIILGVGAVAVSIYIAFSRYGKIKLGNIEKPIYGDFKWGAMIFTSTMAADILFYSLCEWMLYGNDPYITEMGGMQKWAPTYCLFHWGPIAWSFYIVLAVAFGFMIHVRGRDKQKFSEACRPILGKLVDGWCGKLIDLLAVIALLAGTATTFSVSCPLLSAAISQVFHIPNTVVLTVLLLIVIAFVYTMTVMVWNERCCKGWQVYVHICFSFYWHMFFLAEASADIYWKQDFHLLVA